MVKKKRFSIKGSLASSGDKKEGKIRDVVVGTAMVLLRLRAQFNGLFLLEKVCIGENRLSSDLLYL